MDNNQSILNNTRIMKKKNETHYSKKIKKKYQYKQCKICSGKGIRKDTIYYCMKCKEQLVLDLESCLEKYLKEK